MRIRVDFRGVAYSLDLRRKITIVVDLSATGKTRFYRYFAAEKMKVHGVGGNGRIWDELEKNTDPTLLLIADGAALGFLISDILKLQKKKPFLVYFPESFEWVLMLSDYFDDDVKIRSLTANIEDELDYRHESTER